MNTKPKHTTFKPKASFALIGLLIGLYLFGFQSTGFSQDSGELDWKYPVRIPQHDDNSRPPTLVADNHDTVHSFTADLSKRSAIAYRTWTKDVGWSIPIDIILPPRAGTATIFGAEIDNDDTLHLVIFYGIEGDAGIYHSQAPIYSAKSASAWSLPQLITDGAGPLADGHFVSDGDDRLHVVYEGDGDGLGLYEVYSEDAGVSWSDPSIIYLSAGGEFLPAAVDTYIDHEGTIHAVWSVWSASLGAGVELFYSHREKQSKTWTRPYLLADKDQRDYESDWGSITLIDGELMVLYQDDFPATKWMRKSRDNGQNWTDPERPWPHIGEYENAVFLNDSNGQLHVILGNRAGDCCHGMWHSRYEDGKWQELKAIIQGPKTIDFDPSKPSAVMLHGNFIFVAWWMDTTSRNGAWFSHAYLEDVEPLPITPVKVPVSNLEPELAPSENITATEAPRANLTILPDDQKLLGKGDTPSSAITAGVVASFFGALLGMAIWYFFYKLR